MEDYAKGEVPVFRFTWEQWRDPIAVAEALARRPDVQRAGIAKLVPPEDWRERPERAKERVMGKGFEGISQKVHELQRGARSDREDRFRQDYSEWLDSLGVDLPNWHGKTLDPWVLHDAVRRRGGYDKVTADRRWRDVARCVGTPENQLTSATTGSLKQLYAKYLAPYLDRSLTPPQPDGKERSKGNVKEEDDAPVKADEGAQQQHEERDDHAGQQKKRKGGGKSKARGKSGSKKGKRKPKDDEEEVVPAEDEEEDEGDRRHEKGTSERNNTQMEQEANASKSEEGIQELLSLWDADDSTHQAEPEDEMEDDVDDEEKERQTAFERSATIMLSRGEDDEVVSGARGLAKAAKDLSIGHSDHLCEVCFGGGAGDKMVLCDRCDRGWHAFCLTPELESLPEGDWYCPECTQSIHCLHSLGAEATGTATPENVLRHSGVVKKRWFRSARADAAWPFEVIRSFWSIVDTEYSGPPVDAFSAESQRHTAFGHAAHSDPWDLTNFARKEGSLMVHVPEGDAHEAERTLRIGSTFSCIGWGFEHMGLFSVSYLHWGESRVWYSVGSKDSDRAEAAVKRKLDRALVAHPHLIYRRDALPPPSCIEDNGGPRVHCTVQEEGTFVICLPGAFTACVDVGANISEKAPVAPLSWLLNAERSLERLRVLHVSPPFSLANVLWRAAQSGSPRDPLGNKGLLAQGLFRVIQAESRGRYAALSRGVVRSSDSLGEWDDEPEWCCVCGADLWEAQVMCQRCDPQRRVCLAHAMALCDCDPDPHHVLLYRSSLARLHDALDAAIAKPCPSTGPDYAKALPEQSTERYRASSQVSLQDLDEAAREPVSPLQPDPGSVDPPEDARRWAVSANSILTSGKPVEGVEEIESVMREAEKWLWGGREMDQVRDVHSKLSRAISWMKRLPWPEGGCASVAELEDATRALQEGENFEHALTISGRDLVERRINAAKEADRLAKEALARDERSEAELEQAAKSGERCECVCVSSCNECRRLVDAARQWRRDAGAMLSSSTASRKPTVSHARRMLARAEREKLPLGRDEFEEAQSALRNADEFCRRVKDVFSREALPDLHRVKELREEASKLRVVSSVAQQMEGVVDEAADWERRVENALASQTSAMELDMLYREGQCLPLGTEGLLDKLSRMQRPTRWCERVKELLEAGEEGSEGNLSLDSAKELVSEGEQLASEGLLEREGDAEPAHQLQALYDLIERAEAWASEAEETLRSAREDETRLEAATLESMLSAGRSFGSPTLKPLPELEEAARNIEHWCDRAMPMLRPKSFVRKGQYIARVEDAESLLEEAQSMLAQPREEPTLRTRVEQTRHWQQEAQQLLSQEYEPTTTGVERHLDSLDCHRRRSADLVFSVDTIGEVKSKVSRLRGEFRARRLLEKGGSLEDAESILKSTTVPNELIQCVSEKLPKAKEWQEEVKALWRSGSGKPTADDVTEHIRVGEQEIRIVPPGELASLKKALDAHKRWHSRFGDLDLTEGKEPLERVRAAVSQRENAAKAIHCDLFEHAKAAYEEAEEWQNRACSSILREGFDEDGSSSQQMSGLTLDEILLAALERMRSRVQAAISALRADVVKHDQEERSEQQEGAEGEKEGDHIVEDKFAPRSKRGWANETLHRHYESEQAVDEDRAGRNLKTKEEDAEEEEDAGERGEGGHREAEPGKSDENGAEDGKDAIEEQPWPIPSSAPERSKRRRRLSRELFEGEEVRGKSVDDAITSAIKGARSRLSDTDARRGEASTTKPTKQRKANLIVPQSKRQRQRQQQRERQHWGRKAVQEPSHEGRRNRRQGKQGESKGKKKGGGGGSKKGQSSKKRNEIVALVEAQRGGSVDKMYCLCHCPDNGLPMVACDCCGRWFHYKCVGLDPQDPVEEHKCPVCKAWRTGDMRQLDPMRLNIQQGLTNRPFRDRLKEFSASAEQLRAIPPEKKKLDEALDLDRQFWEEVRQLWEAHGPVASGDTAKRAAEAFEASLSFEMAHCEELGLLAWLAFGGAWRAKQAASVLDADGVVSVERLEDVFEATGAGKVGQSQDPLGKEVEALLKAAQDWISRARSVLQRCDRRRACGECIGLLTGCIMAYSRDAVETAGEATELLEEAKGEKLQRVDLSAVVWELEWLAERHCLCGEPQGSMEMVMCDLCDGWFHLPCVGLDANVAHRLVANDLSFHCPNCCEARDEPYTVEGAAVALPTPGSAGPSSLLAGNGNGPQQPGKGATSSSKRSGKRERPESVGEDENAPALSQQEPPSTSGPEAGRNDGDVEHSGRKGDEESQGGRRAKRRRSINFRAMAGIEEGTL